MSGKKFTSKFKSGAKEGRPGDGGTSPCSGWSWQWQDQSLDSSNRLFDQGEKSLAVQYFGGDFYE